MELRIGNSLKDGHQAFGTIRMFRAGKKKPSSYEYDTLPLNEINSAFPESEHITVNEIERFFERAGKGQEPQNITDPRMTSHADVFAVMDTGSNLLWSRSDGNPVAGGIHHIRNWRSAADDDVTVGVIFRVYKSIGGESLVVWGDASDITWGAGADYNWAGESINRPLSTEVWFDNAQVKLSNILWEFCPGDGDGKWYQLYDLPNKAYTRMTLPDATNRLRIRAMSNNPDEWVQNIVLTPKPDYQTSPQKYGAAGEGISIGDITVDQFGYVSWETSGSNENIVTYEVVFYHDNEELVHLHTKDTSYRYDDISQVTEISVTAYGIKSGATKTINL